MLSVRNKQMTYSYKKLCHLLYYCTDAKIVGKVYDTTPWQTLLIWDVEWVLEWAFSDGYLWLYSGAQLFG